MRTLRVSKGGTNLGVLAFLVVLHFFAGAYAQTDYCPRPDTPAVNGVREIDVKAARPVAAALDVIEKRYGVAIDYSDPQYAFPADLVMLPFGMPVARPEPFKKVETFRFEYNEVMNGNGEGYPAALALKKKAIPYYIPDQREQPEGGITALIQRLLDQYASDGGPNFSVQELQEPLGPVWVVQPLEARNKSGMWVHQTDFLDATIYIPTARRTPLDMLALIGQQLTEVWGRTFIMGPQPINALVEHKAEFGAEHIPARQALLYVLGSYYPPFVWRMFYSPGDGSYVVNIVGLPYRQPPRPAPPPPEPAVKGQTRLLSPFEWLRRSHTAQGVLEIQTVLAQMGYLHGAPASHWDAKAIDAIRGFQAAHGLEPTAGNGRSLTGVLDIPTVVKLAPYLPAVYIPASPPGKPSLMYPALSYWLDSTPEGQKEIQIGLAQAGFYSGSPTCLLDDKTRDALRAFQQANGLQVNGIFDDPTANALAPFLPKPN